MSIIVIIHIINRENHILSVLLLLPLLLLHNCFVDICGYFGTLKEIISQTD